MFLSDGVGITATHCRFVVKTKRDKHMCKLQSATPAPGFAEYQRELWSAENAGW